MQRNDKAFFYKCYGLFVNSPAMITVKSCYKITKSHSFAKEKSQEINHKIVVFEHYLVNTKAAF